MNIKTFELAYEEIIFEENVKILCEQLDLLSSIVTESNFLDLIKTIWNKVTNLFDMCTSAFEKGYQAVVSFSKTIFKSTFAKNILNKLGLTDETMLQLIGAIKRSFNRYSCSKDWNKCSH